MSVYFNILTFLWALFISVFSIPPIINAAHQKRLLDIPNSRTVHEQLTPRLGGLAIFAGFISSLTLFGKIDIGIKELIAGSIIMFFIGLKDDIISVSAFKKFFVQVLAAGVVMFIGKVRITSFYGLFEIYEISDGMSYMITFICLIGITNAINLIDGLDGLAGSVLTLICLFFGLGFFMLGNKEYAAYATVAFALLGSILGFLRYNFRNAIIFMGDTGSLISGFIVSVLAIKFIEMDAVTNNPVFTISILFLPIVDTLRVFTLRVFNGKSPFSPDKNHLHHRLVDLGLNQVLTLTALLVINLVAVVLVFYFRNLSINNVFLLLLGYAFLVISLIELFYRLKSAKISNFA